MAVGYGAAAILIGLYTSTFRPSSHNSKPQKRPILAIRVIASRHASRSSQESRTSILTISALSSRKQHWYLGMGSLRADVAARLASHRLGWAAVQLNACGLEHVVAHSSDRFGDFAGVPVEIGGRLFRYRRDVGVEWLFHAHSQTKSAI